MRLIDADACTKLFDKEFKETMRLIRQGETYLDNLAEGFAEAHIVIRSMPSVDAVNVVRCKDCKHSDDECHKDGLRSCMRGIKADDYNETGHIYLFKELVRDVDYCSYGERRKEGNGDS